MVVGFFVVGALQLFRPTCHPRPPPNTPIPTTPNTQPYPPPTQVCQRHHPLWPAAHDPAQWGGADLRQRAGHRPPCARGCACWVVAISPLAAVALLCWPAACEEPPVEPNPTPLSPDHSTIRPSPKQNKPFDHSSFLSQTKQNNSQQQAKSGAGSRAAPPPCVSSACPRSRRSSSSTTWAWGRRSWTGTTWLMIWG